MKKFLVLSILGIIMCACNSKKLNPEHESITFLNVVDSICQKHESENGYDPKEVKKGMHKYVNYYAANENPIFSDLPLTVNSIMTSNTLDGKKLVTACMSYENQIPTKDGKCVYSIQVWVENEFDADEQIPFSEGHTYYIEPNNGIVDYDGALDVIGIEESIKGDVIDGRSFGVLKIKGAAFKEAK